MLGHADREMTMHYTHVEGERVRAGLERVADRLLKKREAGGGARRRRHERKRRKDAVLFELFL